MVNVTYKYAAKATYNTDMPNGVYVLELNNLATSQTVAEVEALAASAKTTSFDNLLDIDAPFGAALSIAASGAYSGKVTINGYDYLGQMVTEEITANGTTAVAGAKAFKHISSITCASGAAVTVTVSRLLKIGLPYKTTKILAEVRDGANSTTTQLVAPVLTAGTATSSDPRGLLNLTTYAAAAHIRLVLVADNYISATVGGGIFGVPQYHA
jgi:hypothetical protein